MIQEKIFFDSSAILCWYKKQANWEIVDNWLRDVSVSKVHGYICEINLIEILNQIGRHEQSFEIALEFVQDLEYSVGIQKFESNWEIMQKASRFKIKGNIALPVCILLASIPEKSCKILTSDPEFKLFEKQFSFIWL